MSLFSVLKAWGGLYRKIDSFNLCGGGRSSFFVIKDCWGETAKLRFSDLALFNSAAFACFSVPVTDRGIV